MQHQAQETEERMLQQVQLQMKAENLAAQRAVRHTFSLSPVTSLLYLCHNLWLNCMLPSGMSDGCCAIASVLVTSSALAAMCMFAWTLTCMPWLLGLCQPL
jgi:hypothetical protein